MAAPKTAHLKPRLGMLSMIGMTFGILKYVNCKGTADRRY